MALRDILQRRAILAAFSAKQTSSGRQDGLSMPSRRSTNVTFHDDSCLSQSIRTPSCPTNLQKASIDAIL
jgi:hypothetical protein